MLFFIVPISLGTLGLGFWRHRDKPVFVLGLLGTILLIAVVLFGHDLGSEWAESGLTVLGAMIIAYAHFRNTRKRHFFSNQDKTAA